MSERMRHRIAEEIRGHCIDWQGIPHDTTKDAATWLADRILALLGEPGSPAGMRERIAKALFDAFGDGFEEAYGQRPMPEWDATQPALREEWYRDADALLEESEPVGEANGEAGPVETDDHGEAVFQHFVAQAGPYPEGTPVLVMDETEARLLRARLISPTPTQATRARVEELEEALEEIASPPAIGGDAATHLRLAKNRARRALTSQEEDDGDE